MAWSKLSRHVRGYGTAWDKLRVRILERDAGLCQPCLRATPERIHGGTHVDHIISKAKAKRMKWTDEQIDAESNLQCINAECHKAKSAAEEGRMVRAETGVDGWLIVTK